jgi:hypothetical protein
MDATHDNLSSSEPCTSTPILMGDDTLVKVCGEGRVYLDNGCYKNVLHVLKLYVNIFSIY